MGVRLYLAEPLTAGQSVTLSRDQAHYLFTVMRLSDGATVEVFNNHDGAWHASAHRDGKRGGAVTPLELLGASRQPPDLWLLFAPIKKARTDFIVEKAAELGARRICPVQTAYTNSERIRRDRLQAHAVEAAEQCGGTFVPEVAELARLDRTLGDWPGDRRLIFCDETRAGPGLAKLQPGPTAILIGPEGGFSNAERTQLGAVPGCQAISLGPRILRADTAAVAALTLWQATAGDWQTE